MLSQIPADMIGGTVICVVLPEIVVGAVRRVPFAQ